MAGGLLNSLLAVGMDRWDWLILAIAVLSLPATMLANWRWLRKSLRGELPRDWQSIWLMALATVCMVLIIFWYVCVYIVPRRY